MKIGMIGAGKVGFSLGRFFAQGGVPLTGYWSRRRESAQEAAEFTGAKAYENLKELVQDSDALFFTVPDGAISQVYLDVRELGISGKQICHCSGAMSAGEAFPGIEQTGAFGYSIHPLFPVSSKFDSYRELTGAFFCLEGLGPHLNDWKKLLEALGAKTQIIPSQCKAQYHAACAVASNLVCALVQESLELLEPCGFSQENALTALAPLMRSNLEHLIAHGPVQALTGPVERGDTDTVRRHLSCLHAPLERTLYAAASRKLVEVARQKNPQRDYGPLERLLDTQNIPYNEEKT